MRYSENFGLNLVEGSDVVNPLVHDVANYEKIDEIMKANESASISKATELLTGTVHAITRDKQGSPMFRFVATSVYTTGDTFTVDGNQVTALTTTGEPLTSGAYIIGSNVLCCLTGTLLTLFVGVGGQFKAYDSSRLGGKEAREYATSTQVANAINIAQAAQNVANNNSMEVIKDGVFTFHKYANGQLVGYAKAEPTHSNDYVMQGYIETSIVGIDLSKPHCVVAGRGHLDNARSGFDIIPFAQVTGASETSVTVLVGCHSYMANLGTWKGQESKLTLNVVLFGYWK